MLDSFIPLYSYCESFAGPISQPLNFLSCIVFWLAAVWLWTRGEEDDEVPSFHQVASIILFLLGLTGMAWHVSGNSFALAADLFTTFMLLIVIGSVLCNDVLRLNLMHGMMTVLFILLISAVMHDAAFLPQNGGLFLPSLFFLAVVSLKIQTVNEEVTIYLLSASYTLFFGLLCRSLDGVLCGHFAQGLHFLWHIMLVVSVIYISKTLTAMKKVPWPGEEKKAAKKTATKKAAAAK